MTFTEEQLNKLFWSIAIDLQEAIKSKLLDLDIKFTGAAVSSVRVIVDGQKLVISMNDYLEYIEYGMPNPTSPEELRDWVEKKLLDGYTGKNKEKAIDRISKTLAKHITLFGPRPRPFLRPTLHTELPKIINSNIAKF
ncbi:hypothetical protein HN777_00590 [Candidatus Woesearchaeota archaeon]|jgi:hypothetical protein|nr:hypothetical protein [Candidatus Woesearchaeota archaeon]